MTVNNQLNNQMSNHLNNHNFIDEPNVQSNDQIDPTNLIINYLPLAVKETDLRRLFDQFGSIDRCKIVYDPATGMSKGFGFVKYHSVEHANEAIKHMNGYRWFAKRLKVAVSQPSLSNEQFIQKLIKQSTLYVGGLPKSYSLEDLCNLFEAFGTIVNAKLLYFSNPRDQSNYLANHNQCDDETLLSKNKGIGFITFESPDEARVAIECLNDRVIDGSRMKLVVRVADDTSEKVSRIVSKTQHVNSPLRLATNQSVSQSISSHTNSPLMISNNPPTMQPLNGANGLHHSPTILPSASRLQNLSSNLRSHEIHPVSYEERILNPSINQSNNVLNHPATHSQHRPKKQSYLGPCLFIYNLAPSVTESGLWALASSYARVTSCKIARDATGASRGFGFVNVENEVYAKQMIDQLNDVTWHGKRLRVSLKADTQRKSHDDQISL